MRYIALTLFLVMCTSVAYARVYSDIPEKTQPQKKTVEPKPKQVEPPSPLSSITCKKIKKPICDNPVPKKDSGGCIVGYRCVEVPDTTIATYMQKKLTTTTTKTCKDAAGVVHQNGEIISACPASLMVVCTLSLQTTTYRKCQNGTWVNVSSSTGGTTPTLKTCTSQGKQYNDGEQINSCVQFGQSACSRASEFPTLTCHNGQWTGFNN